VARMTECSRFSISRSKGKNAAGPEERLSDGHGGIPGAGEEQKMIERGIRFEEDR